MRPASLLVGTCVAVACLASTVTAQAAVTGHVNGSISVGSTTCSWTNATTSNVPPNTLIINRTSVHPTCTGSISATLTNSPTITFQDTAGTAKSPQINVSATVAGITCGYKVTNITIKRQGTTRTYKGGPYTATKISGSFLCPSTETISSATLTFH